MIEGSVQYRRALQNRLIELITEIYKETKP